MADRGEGLRVRLARVPGETPKGVLSSPLILPAVMRAVGWTEEASHSEYDTVRGGQFSQPAQGSATARRLRTLDDIETLTVTWNPVWLVEQGLDPAAVRNSLYAVLRSRRPVELLMTLRFGSPSLLRMNVTVRSITAQMREGEPDTIYYTLRISEWRRSEAKKRGAGTGGSRLPTTHKLTATDTLYSLSEHYYRTAANADAIAGVNGITKWGKKTPLVRMKRYKVGSKIKIPKVVTHTNTVRTP